MTRLVLEPIGIIHSPYVEPEGTPIQPAAAEGVLGSVDVFPVYVPGLQDLEGFSHIILVYRFHLAGPPALQVTPFLDDHVHGVFATRAPARPNAIGLSVVRLLGIDCGSLAICDMDVLDGTPLLDIKPYVPEFDTRAGAAIGWLQGRTGRLSSARDDDRFGR